jgi:hypothetical protein
MRTELMRFNSVNTDRRNDGFKERGHRGHELCEVLRRRIKAVSVAECGPLSISDGFLRKSEIQRAITGESSVSLREKT